jgi:hypothetical protein
LTLAVVQQGGQYQLDGVDDQCGAGQSAAARGPAFQNPDLSIGFGLTVVTAPGGTAVHVDATIGLSTLSGTWRDSAGNTGTFTYSPGGIVPGLPPRPVPSGGLPPGSITSGQLATGAVTATKIGAGAVTGTSVADGSLTSADFLGAPRVASSSGDQDAPIGFSDGTYRTVTLTVPSAGRVMVTTSGYFDLTANTVDSARCSITAGNSIDYGHLIIALDGTASASFVPFSSTRVFDVTAGSFTARLVCNQASGSPRLGDSTLTALFIGS